MKKIILFFLLLLGLSTCPSVYAQLLIEEGKVKLTVSPKESVVNTITINNTSNQSIPVKVYWQDFKYIEPYDGKKAFLLSGSTNYSLAKWVSFSPQEFTLPPYGKKKINYILKVPEDAQGGYYGVLFFEKGEAEKKNETGVRLIVRVGCLFFIEATDKIKQGSVENVILKGKTLSGTFTNTGNVVLVVKGVYYIMDKEGIVIDRGEFKNMYLPPAAKSPFSADLSKNLKNGQYTFVMTFDMDDGDTSVKEVDFVKDATNSFKLLQVRD